MMAEGFYVAFIGPGMRMALCRGNRAGVIDCVDPITTTSTRLPIYQRMTNPYTITQNSLSVLNNGREFFNYIYGRRTSCVWSQIFSSAFSRSTRMTLAFGVQSHL
jgi:hypothetical protein